MSYTKYLRALSEAPRCLFHSGGWRTTLLMPPIGFDELIATPPIPQPLRSINCVYARNNQQTPIDELYMGLFYPKNKATTLLAMTVIPHITVSGQIIHHLRKRKVEFEILDKSNAYDQRTRIGITSDNRKRLSKFFKVVDEVSPFDNNLKRVCNEILNVRDAIASGKVSPFAINWKDFFKYLPQNNIDPVALRSVNVTELITPGYVRYNPWRHHKPHPYQAQLLTAIYNDDYSAVKHIVIVEDHPELVVTPLSNGEDIIVFCLHNGNTQITDLLLSVREQKFPLDGFKDARRKILFHKQNEYLKQRGEPRFGSDKPKDPLIIPEFHDDPLHTAVKYDMREEVLRIIKKDPASLERKNSMGFTAVEIAAGSGNAYLLFQLLSHAVQYGQPQIASACVLDSARDADTMFKALRFKPTLNVFSVRLHEAVRAGEHEIVAIMLDYGVQVYAQDDYGLTAFDLALQHAIDTKDLRMLNVFLLRYRRKLIPVVDGPCDAHVPECVVKRLRQHNFDVRRKIQDKQLRPKIIGLPKSNDQGHIETRLKNDEVTVTSTILRLSDLKSVHAANMDEIEKTYLSAFDALVPPGKQELSERESNDIKSKLFNKVYPDVNPESVFVQLCTIGDIVASSFAFKIEDKEDYVTVIGLLATAHVDYDGMGLANLYNMVQLAVALIYPNKPVYCVYRCAPPYFGMGLPPFNSSPRFYENGQERMRKIADDAGYPMRYIGISDTPLISTRGQSNNAIYQEAIRLRNNPLEVENDDAPEELVRMRGLLAYWLMSPENCAALLEKLAPHAIDKTHIEKFADRMRTFLSLPKIEKPSNSEVKMSATNKKICEPMGYVFDIDTAMKHMTTLDGKPVKPEETALLYIKVMPSDVKVTKREISPGFFEYRFKVKGRLEKLDIADRPKKPQSIVPPKAKL